MWRDINLGQNIDVISGFAFSSLGFNDEENGLPLIRIRDIDSDDTQIYYSGQYQEAFVVNRNDVLVGMDGEFNIHKWKGARSLLNQRVLMLREKRKSDLDITFTYYWLSPFLKDVEHKTAATTVKHLTSKDVKNAEILAPKKSIQQKIGKILQATDSSIEKTQALIAKYENIKQGMMQDLFTRGVDENGQLRPSYEEALHLYQETELGWIPKEWGYGLLEEISNKVTDGDHHTPIRQSDGIYLLSARNVGDTNILLEDVDYVGETEYERMIKRCHPEVDDILISCSGTVGRVCIVPSWLKCVLVRSAALVKQDRDKIEAKFLLWMLRSDFIQSQIKNSMFQAAQPNLFQGAINKLKVVTPTKPEQKEISLRLDGIQKAIESETTALNKLKNKKLGLMQDLLTGKVRVAEDMEEHKEAVA